MTAPAMPAGTGTAPDPAALAFTLLFLFALSLATIVRVWLAARQIRHVARHRDAVPAAFAGRVPLDAHRRAAAYTIARTRLVFVDAMVSAGFVLALTVFGGLQALWDLTERLAGDWLFARELAVAGAVVTLGALVDLPLDAWRRFRLEQRFGFNRMKPALWFTDLARGAVLSALLGLPLAAAVIALMHDTGTAWWFRAWLVWMAFTVAMMVLFPLVFARWFNRFEPLGDGPLRERLEALIARCGFPAGGLYVMDGSRRSAHGNAYFTGFGKARRIVLFDTLVAQLPPDEIEAVLAHEIGHFRLNHVWKRVVAMHACSLAALALLGWLSRQGWFFQGLGVTPAEGLVPGLALVLFMLAGPSFSALLGPLGAMLSRRHEYEADAYAARMTSGPALARALVRLYRDNAATLTPDPLHSAFHDSHPPAAARIGRLMIAPAQPALSAPTTS